MTELEKLKKINQQFQEKFKEFQQTQEEIRQQLEQLFFQPTEKPTERWKPESHEQYLFVNYRLDISTDLFLGFDSCNLKIRKGNAFPEGMKDYLEREHVKLIQFHNEMANILWQIDRESLTEDTNGWTTHQDKFKNPFKKTLMRLYGHSTQEKAELGWSMLSEDIKNWLTT